MVATAVIVSTPMLAGETGTEYVNDTSPLAAVAQPTGLHVPVAPALWPPTVNATGMPPI